MSEGMFGLFLLVVITIVVTCIVRYFKSHRLDCIGTSSVISLVIFHIAAYLHAGIVDKFLLLSLIVGFVYILLLSASTYFLIRMLLKIKSKYSANTPSI